MKIRKRNRLIAIISMLTVCSLGIWIILSNLSDNIVFFYPPSEISKIQSADEKVRVGGLVKEGSIKELSDKKISFTITDQLSELNIEYEGLLPTLFRENQGIVAEGKLVSKNRFIASKLLAKHDENYKPPSLSKPLQNTDYN